MQRWVLSLLFVIIGICAAFGWREWTYRVVDGERSVQVAALQDEVRQLETAVQAVGQEKDELAEALSGSAVTVQSLRDRSANLEAQRDHLQSEVKRQRERAEVAETGIESARVELENVREALLEQSNLPRQLESRLEQAQHRIGEMEAALDASALALSEGPPLLTVEDLSADRTVISLTGSLPEAGHLPLPVYLCRRDTVVLEGWIHRYEEGLAIGHVLGWREPASTLVKGEKVFILPKNHHEAEP